MLSGFSIIQFSRSASFNSNCLCTSKLPSASCISPLIVSDGLFPDMISVIEHSALMPLNVLRLARIATIFDKISERLIGSPVHRHIWRLILR